METITTSEGTFQVREANDGTYWVQAPDGQIIVSGITRDEAPYYVIEWVGPAPVGRTIDTVVL